MKRLKAAALLLLLTGCDDPTVVTTPPPQLPTSPENHIPFETVRLQSDGRPSWYAVHKLEVDGKKYTLFEAYYGERGTTIILDKKDQ